MVTGNCVNANQSGIQSYDGAGTWQGRVLNSGTANLTITNPDGIAGNPTFTIVGFMTWTDVTGTTQAMSVTNGYVADNASLVTFTLPSTANIGDVIQVLGKGAGGWKIAQNASQQINVGKVASTAGTGGSIASTNQYDTVELRCITAGASTIWTAKVTGNITVV
jgi:hypothetical protein